MNDYPRIWAIYCHVTQEIEYSTTKYTSAQGFFNSIPETVRDQFSVVRYDANDLFTKNERIK